MRTIIFLTLILVGSTYSFAQVTNSAKYYDKCFYEVGGNCYSSLVDSLVYHRIDSNFIWLPVYNAWDNVKTCEKYDSNTLVLYVEPSPKMTSLFQHKRENIAKDSTHAISNDNAHALSEAFIDTVLIVRKLSTPRMVPTDDLNKYWPYRMVCFRRKIEGNIRIPIYYDHIPIVIVTDTTKIKNYKNNTCRV